MPEKCNFGPQIKKYDEKVIDFFNSSCRSAFFMWGREWVYSERNGWKCKERNAYAWTLCQWTMAAHWFNKTNSDGEFKFSEEAPAFPEIFRLERGGKYIYFPIDSLDNVTITADTANFDTNYRLAGTNNAIWMMQVDSISRELAKLPAGAPAFAEAKAAFAERILVDPSSIVAYYVVNKIIGTTPLYQISDRDDVKIIGAVANAYNSYKPNDPRTEYLKRMFLPVATWR